MIVEPFGEDGHSFFLKGLKIWEPIVDEYLKTLNIKLVDAIIPLPDLKSKSPLDSFSEKGLKAYAEYLESNPHRAFAISKSKGFGYSFSKYSKEIAIEKALENCKKFNDDCEIFDAK